MFHILNKSKYVLRPFRISFIKICLTEQEVPIFFESLCWFLLSQNTTENRNLFSLLAVFIREDLNELETVFSLLDRPVGCISLSTLNFELSILLRGIQTKSPVDSQGVTVSATNFKFPPKAPLRLRKSNQRLIRI